MKILVACEESQAVTREFRRLGHEAYSCDLYPCSGGHPEWHLQQDVLFHIQHYLPPTKDRAMLRSKTFPGIAKAMAEQWGKYILDTKRSENENSKGKMEYFIS